MKQGLRDAIHKALKGGGHRFVGNVLFSLLFLVVLLFCVWFKGAFWNEPLGVDGLILSCVLTVILCRAFPVIKRLINK